MKASIHPSAKIADNVSLGPGVIIGEEVEIGEGTEIGPYSVISARTKIGRNNKIGPFVSIGFPPQHLACKGENTYVEIGEENVIREYVSIHRGTTLDDGLTRIGNRCFIMAYAHIGHDCKLADEIILTNNVNLGGHVKIDRGAVLGGGAMVHQFCRIGELAFVSGLSGVDKDVPPFVRVFGIPAKIAGLNLVGLRRAGFASASIKALNRALKIFLREGTIKEALQKIKLEYPHEEVIEKFVTFVGGESKRGVIRKFLSE
ncbi:acyl-(acyl-carrier-protein)--UDP-N-acetylglucosamine O-acyltransferase [Thermodesulfatator indicus DSM 15286]|uniref:Acyl-(Acyl-carrier-protein)--UDP-N-acetylglucosamine O-acyltransferase n=1 Tax=Thermodesulfatator indicus (strain DSM 15286 / JCM 11887 / CIR29812) TaxID=667014 RepID=F8AAG0_THEID|nr:acyl-ACP--UDP-N-acetylglucosamine O-acyltransferase [Thermodesulfatator indicus]AEH45380.1 acyl-(acyl-carrier-protein)--UDP-N-acetylglucosamine O-acyltransferase [Thermodesulfatator indicus DSM 15286]